MSDDTTTVTTENGHEIRPDDVEHITRLRSLRRTGAVNMVTEVQSGLIATYGEKDGMATYQWMKDRGDLFFSGDWTDCELPDPADE